MLGAVAHDHPIHLAALFLDRGERALLAGFPDQFGVKRQLADLEGFGIDLADQVEINEAVVQRGNQRIGCRGNMTGKRIITARRVENQEVMPFGQFGAQPKLAVGRTMPRRLIVSARFSR